MNMKIISWNWLSRRICKCELILIVSAVITATACFIFHTSLRRYGMIWWPDHGPCVDVEEFAPRSWRISSVTCAFREARQLLACHWERNSPSVTDGHQRQAGAQPACIGLYWFVLACICIYFMSKQIHTNMGGLTTTENGSVMSVLNMYWLVFACFLLVLAKSIHINTINTSMKVLTTYWYVLKCIVMYWWAEKEHWIHTYIIQINTCK